MKKGMVRKRMIVNQIERNFLRAGYKEIKVNVPNIYLYLEEVEDDAYVSVLIDCDKYGMLTNEEYENILREVRKTIFESEFEDVKILGVLCTKSPGVVRQLVDGFGEHWIVDTLEKRLIIYENQVLEFLNARKILECALEGKDYISEKKNTSFEVKEFFSNSLCNVILILINIIVFIAVEWKGSSLDAEHMLSFGAMNEKMVIEQGQYYRLFTHMFLHFGMEHLANNMLVLFYMGSCLEHQLGKLKYLFLYLGAGVFAGGVSMMYNIVMHREDVVSAGASGAIFGVVGAMFWIVLINKGQIEDFSLRQMMIFVFLSLYSGIASQGVDNMAHIGGFIGGIVLAIILYRRAKKEEYST